MGLIQRWTVGEGGFLGEASLVEPGEDELRHYGRKGRYICELTDVFVHPLRRRQGWAGIVVRAALEHADAQQWDTLLRTVAYGGEHRWGRLNTDQLAAFYRGHGFNATRADPRLMIRRWHAT